MLPDDAAMRDETPGRLFAIERSVNGGLDEGTLKERILREG
jgi:hypothetical protein